MGAATTNRSQRAPPSGVGGGPGLWGVGLSGRIGRLPYATAGVLLLTALYAMAWFVLSRPSGMRLALGAFAALCLLFLALRLSVLRCHDANRSGWWSLLMLVPYLDLVVGLLLSFVPGTDGDNDFGEPPREGHWSHALGAVALLGALAALTWPQWMAASQRALATVGDDAAGAQPSGSTAPKLSRAAMVAFRDQYTPAPPFKAFVASADGSWGWKSGAASLDDAIAVATAHCEAYRKASAAPCVPISLNGVAVSSR